MGSIRAKALAADLCRFAAHSGASERLVDLESFDLVGEVVLGGQQIGLRVGELFLSGGDLILGGVQVMDKAVAGGFVGAGECSDVCALAVFIRVQPGEAGVDL